MSFFKWRGGSNSGVGGLGATTAAGAQSSASSSTTTTLVPGLAAANAAAADATAFADISAYADGSDKFFGMENFANTCYCNSVLQCLYYSRPFRDAIMNYPPRATRPQREPRRAVPGENPHPFLVALKAQAEKEALELAQAKSEEGKKKSIAKTKRGSSVISAFSPNSISSVSSSTGSSGSSGAGATTTSAVTSSPITATASSTAGSQRTTTNPNSNNNNSTNEDGSATVEQKKKAALAVGPIINMDHSMNKTYGMEESLFTTLKDIFEAMVENSSRTGVVSPAKLVEVLKRQNELFRSSMHQDAHEFFNFLLNEVAEDVEHHERNSQSANTRWVHELFEGQLTSETKCLTCENVSRRDEMFLDLSIDLEQHSSVTSCLRQFSASEMLCEANKFHCDCCGGLQEAEKRMKIKRLPRILALHLKRFKFTEDMQRNVKLFHKVEFPYHLRLFNTTDDVVDPDRIYELYAVVVHIGGGPYHGHYVSIVKTEHAGWVLYDDEMVERVDDAYVTNFFGDKPGLACAYILFYQQITEYQYDYARRYGASAAAPASTAVPTTAGSDISVASSDGVLQEKTNISLSVPAVTVTGLNGVTPSSLSSTITQSSPLSTPQSSTASSVSSVVSHSTTPAKTSMVMDTSDMLSSPSPSATTTSTNPIPSATRNGGMYQSPSGKAPIGNLIPPLPSADGSVKGKKEGGGGLKRFKSTSMSKNQKFWKKDRDKENGGKKK
ncbi:uncharacterized protein V1518DRAFT_411789 [Limtongia smithiae]|uniref:uncharacterized protein n=1 Tax=Limtongia smithiae TaxID=1125753 RepID=UPI0034CFA598